MPPGPRMAPALISGRWRSDTSLGSATRHSPYDGTPAAVAALCGEAEAAEACAFAAASASRIRHTPPQERAEVLEEAARGLAREAEEITRLESRELGKPIKDTRTEALRAGETLRIAAAEARRLGGEVLGAEGWPAGQGSTAITFRVPVGVVLAITPFNAPLNLLTHKIAASFAAGNTTIVKAPPQAPGTSAALVELLLQAGLPPEAIQLLHGGAELGERLVSAPEVRAIAFTGGPAAGQAVARAAGAKRLVLELGGNAATIVCADADLEDAARVCARTGYSNSGQSCISVQRVYVEEPRFEGFTALFRERVAELRVGDPLDPATDVGTMVDAGAAARVEGWVREAVGAGARLELGGTAHGARLDPTVLAAPPRSARVVAEEVFGALVSILPFRDFGDAIDQANDTPNGLQGGLFTRDIGRAFEAAREFEVGGLVVNGSSNFRLDHVPFGGVKASGLGRESPRWMIGDLTSLRTVIFRGLSLWG